MSSRQRIRSQNKLTVYRTVTITDSRGNKTVQPTAANPHVVRASQNPDRSARAEVPGEMEINVITLRIPRFLEGVNLRSRAEWDGQWWDVVAPPGDRIGNRHTGHWTLTLRKRPGGGGLIV